MEIVTWAVLLAAGAIGGVVMGIVYMLDRPTPPDAWVVIEGWEAGCSWTTWASAQDAKAYIDNAVASGNADAFDWVVRGVVVVRQEGDPR